MSKKPKEITPEKSGENIFVFDFESMFVDGDPIMRKNGFGEVEVFTPKKHIVNFIAVRQLFEGREWVFETLDNFVAFMRETIAMKKKSIMIAHNMKGYDGRILFTHLVTAEGEIPENVIWQGSKIMKYTLFKGRVHVQDSLTHVATSLAKMPAIFGLDESRYKKGFFPYLFNVPENQRYVGSVPPVKYFEPNLMPPAKRKEFFEWYIKQKDIPYDFQKELREYCISDVRILAESMEVYIREGMAANSSMNPLECITIAQYAMRIYKTLYLPPNKVAYLNFEAQSMARASFAGGRTDVRKMLKYWSPDDVQRGYYGVYQDVQSLYPTVQYYDPLPIGHPKITKYIGENGQTLCPQPTKEQLLAVFGFIKCDIALTKYLHHPVLVEKKDDKLIADLLPKKEVRLNSI